MSGHKHVYGPHSGLCDCGKSEPGILAELWEWFASLLSAVLPSVSTDGKLILELTKELRSDPNPPVIDQEFNPTDPVAVEIVLHEADNAIECYMEKWKILYRERFEDPAVYDNFVREYQMKARKDIKRLISEAQQAIAETLSDEEGDEEDKA